MPSPIMHFLVYTKKTGISSDHALVFAALQPSGELPLAMAKNVRGKPGKQILGVMVTIIYDEALTFLILKGIDGVIGLRVTDEQEDAGLDIALHDERGYNR